MVRRIKKLVLIMLVMSALLLTGCNIFSFDVFDGSNEDDNSSVITLAPSEKSENTPASKEEEIPVVTGTEEDNTQESTPTPSDIQPIENIDLAIYSVNVNSGETEAVTALIPADIEITPQLIVDKVVESMADRSIDVGIESVTQKDHAVIVSFYNNKAPLSEIGSSYEAAILDAIAMSLMDNLKDFSKVIYRAEGKAYIGSHIELGIDEAYLEDN